MEPDGPRVGVVQAGGIGMETQKWGSRKYKQIRGKAETIEEGKKWKWKPRKHWKVTGGPLIKPELCDKKTVGILCLSVFGLPQAVRSEPYITHVYFSYM